MQYKRKESNQIIIDLMTSAVAAKKEIAKEEPVEVKKTLNTDIRVTNHTPIGAYLNYIANLFEHNEEKIVLLGTGFAIQTAINLAALVRRKFKGIHQITDVTTIEMPRRLPKNQKSTEKDMRKVAMTTITLSKKELDKTHPCYTAPLADSEVTEYVAAVVPKRNGFVGARRGSYRGRFNRGRRGGFRNGFSQGRYY